MLRWPNAPLFPGTTAKEESIPGLVQELENRALPTALPTGTQTKGGKEIRSDFRVRRKKHGTVSQT